MWFLFSYVSWSRYHTYYFCTEYHTERSAGTIHQYKEGFSGYICYSSVNLRRSHRLISLTSEVQIPKCSFSNSSRLRQLSCRTEYGVRSTLYCTYICLTISLSSVQSIEPCKGLGTRMKFPRCSVQTYRVRQWSWQSVAPRGYGWRKAIFRQSRRSRKLKTLTE